MPPSCPVRLPLARNVRFYPTAAAAQRAGFREGLQALPPRCVAGFTAVERSAADVVACAMRLIADGTVDRDGVNGLAARLGYTTRQLNACCRAKRGRAAGAGPCPAGPDGADPDRDDVDGLQ